MESPDPQPLCVAPFTALLIDPDKGVRPCCRFFDALGAYVPGSVAIGRLDPHTTASDIMAGPAWRGIAQQLAARKVPPGCRECIQRERDTGYAGRRDYDDPDWRQGLTYLEINTSNVCTLQCRHCDGYYSHLWAPHQGLPTHRADSELLLRSLRGLDLSHLNSVAFKGGEPLINPDLVAVLEHLAAIGRLEQVVVRITTNGTVARGLPLELLGRARRCEIGISVDGVGELQTYIRHGNSAGATIARFVAAASAIPRVRFGIIVSVMAYNVFALPAIADWWRTLAGYDPRRRWQARWRRWRRRAEFQPISFFHFVTSPAHLCVSSLQDHTRARAAAQLERLDPELYAHVIHMLRRPFAGNHDHDRLVLETLKNDQLLGRSFREALPELRDEMVLLDPAAARADLQRRRQQGQIGAAEAEREDEALATLAAGAPRT